MARSSMLFRSSAAHKAAAASVAAAAKLEAVAQGAQAASPPAATPPAATPPAAPAALPAGEQRPSTVPGLVHLLDGDSSSARPRSSPPAGPAEPSTLEAAEPSRAAASRGCGPCVDVSSPAMDSPAGQQVAAAVPSAPAPATAGPGPASRPNSLEQYKQRGSRDKARSFDGQRSGPHTAAGSRRSSTAQEPKAHTKHLTSPREHQPDVRAAQHHPHACSSLLLHGWWPQRSCETGMCSGSCHSRRHTAAVLAIRCAAVDPADVAGTLGHSSSALYEAAVKGQDPVTLSPFPVSAMHEVSSFL